MIKEAATMEENNEATIIKDEVEDNAEDLSDTETVILGNKQERSKDMANICSTIDINSKTFDIADWLNTAIGLIHNVAELNPEPILKVIKNLEKGKLSFEFQCALEKLKEEIFEKSKPNEKLKEHTTFHQKAVESKPFTASKSHHNVLGSYCEERTRRSSPTFNKCDKMDLISKATSLSMDIDVASWILNNQSKGNDASSLKQPETSNQPAKDQYKKTVNNPKTNTQQNHHQIPKLSFKHCTYNEEASPLERQTNVQNNKDLSAVLKGIGQTLDDVTKKLERKKVSRKSSTDVPNYIKKRNAQKRTSVSSQDDAQPNVKNIRISDENSAPISETPLKTKPSFTSMFLGDNQKLNTDSSKVQTIIKGTTHENIQYSLSKSGGATSSKKKSVKETETLQEVKTKATKRKQSELSTNETKSNAKKNTIEETDSSVQKYKRLLKAREFVALRKHEISSCIAPVKSKSTCKVPEKTITNLNLPHSIKNASNCDNSKCSPESKVSSLNSIKNTPMTEPNENSKMNATAQNNTDAFAKEQFINKLNLIAKKHPEKNEINDMKKKLNSETIILLSPVPCNENETNSNDEETNQINLKEVKVSNLEEFNLIDLEAKGIKQENLQVINLEEEPVIIVENSNVINLNDAKAIKEEKIIVINEEQSYIINLEEPLEIDVENPNVIKRKETKVTIPDNPKVMNRQEPSVISNEEVIVLDEEDPIINLEKPEIITREEPKVVTEEEPNVTSQAEPKLTNEAESKLINVNQAKLINLEELIANNLKEPKVIKLKEPPLNISQHILIDPDLFTVTNYLDLINLTGELILHIIIYSSISTNFTANTTTYKCKTYYDEEMFFINKRKTELNDKLQNLFTYIYINNLDIEIFAENYVQHFEIVHNYVIDRIDFLIKLKELLINGRGFCLVICDFITSYLNNTEEYPAQNSSGTSVISEQHFSLLRYLIFLYKKLENTTLNMIASSRKDNVPTDSCLFDINSNLNINNNNLNLNSGRNQQRRVELNLNIPQVMGRYPSNVNAVQPNNVNGVPNHQRMSTAETNDNRANFSQNSRQISFI